ncbi:MAG: beta-N-acetylhexosaminidase [Gammaproteobacteria bacterium]
MSLGPVMLDLRGPELEADERDMLRHPRVGGVILFARNYRDPRQLAELTRRVHELRQPPLLIAVDHEGGRVQRFRDQFTHLPPCRSYGEIYDRDPAAALELCRKAGWLLAMELLAVGVDFSFAPVLDLDTGQSRVIGDRAFHASPDTVTALARERLIGAGLAGIMPAHVIYRRVDEKPAGFSTVWLQRVLRRELGFRGAIFSDDISMAGAEVAGNYNRRAMAALGAGCDMVLACNDQAAAVKLLEDLEVDPDPLSQVRFMRMHGRDPGVDLAGLKRDLEWQAVASKLASLDIAPELNLGDDERET